MASRSSMNAVEREGTVLYLQLDRKTREELKSVLNEFSNVLRGNQLELKEQKQLLERNRQLILKLSRLPRFYRETPIAPRSRSRSRGARRSPSRSPNRRGGTLVLAHHMRMGILDVLYLNQDYSILFNDFFSERSKRHLIELNNRLVVNLNDLTARPSEKRSRRFKEFAKLMASKTSSSEGAFEFLF